MLRKNISTLAHNGRIYAASQNVIDPPKGAEYELYKGLIVLQANTPAGLIMKWVGIRLDSTMTKPQAIRPADYKTWHDRIARHADRLRNVLPMGRVHQTDTLTRLASADPASLSPSKRRTLIRYSQAADCEFMRQLAGHAR